MEFKYNLAVPVGIFSAIFGWRVYSDWKTNIDFSQFAKPKLVLGGYSQFIWTPICETEDLFSVNDDFHREGEDDSSMNNVNSSATGSFADGTAWSQSRVTINLPELRSGQYSIGTFVPEVKMVSLASIVHDNLFQSKVNPHYSGLSGQKIKYVPDLRRCPYRGYQRHT